MTPHNANQINECNTKCKTENKICKPKYKDDMQDKKKQKKMLEGKDGQDDAHVGATSPSLE